MTQKPKPFSITTSKAPAKPDNQLQILSALVSRAMMFSKLGYEYGGDRNLYTALGYQTQLNYQDFVAQYERQELAKAVIDRPVSATWRGGFDLLESDDDTETQLEAAWAELYDRLALRSVFARLDRLTGLGRYGVLFLGLSDATSPYHQSLEVQGVKHKLLYVKPYGENHAVVSRWETNSANPRYGLPLEYQLTNTDLLSNVMVTLQVHHSRVIHVADGTLESDIEGTPRLESIFNRLKDVEKIAGGSAEMFWRGARPGYAFNMDPEFNMTQAMRDTLIDVFDEYEHNLRRILELQGGKLESLAQQVADPEKHIDVQIQLISADTGIPKRILTGSERGELASTQDNEGWQSVVQGRREEFAEPSIIRPFVDRLLGWKILPEPGKDGYSIRWLDLFAMSEKEKVEIGVKRTEAIAKYAASPGASAVMPARSFYRVGLALDDEAIELIEEELEKALAEALELEPEPVVPEGETEPGIEGEPSLTEEEVNRELGITAHGGNFGHAGRPGQVGGSSKRGASATIGDKKKKSSEKSSDGWKPTMSGAEANKWTENSSFKEPLFHGTSATGVSGIKKSGFSDDENGKFTGNGGLYGRGHYFTLDKNLATQYAREGTKPLEVRVNVKKTCETGDYSKIVGELAKTPAFQKISPLDMHSRPAMIRKELEKRGYDSINIKVGARHEFIVFNQKSIVVVGK